MRFAIFRNEENDESLLHKDDEQIDSARVGSLEDMAKLLELSEAEAKRLLEEGYICYDRNGDAVVAGRYRGGFY